MNIKIGQCDFPVDGDGVIDVPLTSKTMRYINGDELREFKIEFYSGAHGKVRSTISRTVVRRIAPRPVVMNARGPAKRAA